MKKYLLDTSICVFLFRRKYGIEEKLQKIGVSQCYVSEVTIVELKYGAYKSDCVKEKS
jgi:tRNA(fMet)-specific endonuclease VapC